MVRVGSSTLPKKPTPEGWIGASRAGHPQPSLQRRTNFPASQKNTMSKIPMAEDLQKKLMESGSMAVLKDDHLDKSGGI